MTNTVVDGGCAERSSGLRIRIMKNGRNAESTSTTATPIIFFYNSEKNFDKAIVGSSLTVDGVMKKTSIDISELPDISGGSIKVFLWDNTDSIKPLTGIITKIN